MAQRRMIELTHEQHQELLWHRDHDPRPYVRERCAAVLKVAEGRTPYWIAQQGLLKQWDPDTLYAWLDYYQLQGLPGLIAHQHGGARRRYLQPKGDLDGPVVPSSR